MRPYNAKDGKKFSFILFFFLIYHLQILEVEKKSITFHIKIFINVKFNAFL